MVLSPSEMPVSIMVITCDDILVSSFVLLLVVTGPKLVSGFFYSSPKDMLIDFREGGREKERERNMNVREKQSVASCTRPDQGLNCNLGMCPDQESNL